MTRLRVAAICVVLGMLQACYEAHGREGPLELPRGSRGESDKWGCRRLGSAFEKSNSVHLVPSYGATAQLTQQITAGAPYDVLLACRYGTRRPTDQIR